MGNRNLSLEAVRLINNSGAAVGSDLSNGFINISAPSPSLFLSNHIIYAVQEGRWAVAPCVPSPVSGQERSSPCQLELATLVLTALG